MQAAWERGHLARMSSCDRHVIMNEHKKMENQEHNSGCCVLCGQDARAPRLGTQYGGSLFLDSFD